MHENYAQIYFLPGTRDPCIWGLLDFAHPTAFYPDAAVQGVGAPGRSPEGFSLLQTREL